MVYLITFTGGGCPNKSCKDLVDSLSNHVIVYIIPACSGGTVLDGQCLIQRHSWNPVKSWPEAKKDCEDSGGMLAQKINISPDSELNLHFGDDGLGSKYDGADNNIQRVTITYKQGRGLWGDRGSAFEEGGTSSILSLLQFFF